MSSSGFRDGLGKRDLAFDRQTGQVWERLLLRAELSAFEAALRRRVAQLTLIENPRLVPLRSVDRDRATSKLVVVSQHLSGLRLSDLLRAARERELIPDFTVAILLTAEILASVHALHASSSLAHGAVNADRVIVAPSGQVALADYAFGEVLAAARFSPRRLWEQFGIAHWLGEPFSEHADVRHAALVAIALTLGRPIGQDDFPHALTPLLGEVHEAAMIRGGRLFAEPVGAWMSRAVATGSTGGFDSAGEAAHACAELLTDREREAARQALLHFLEEAGGAIDAEAGFAVEPPDVEERPEPIAARAAAFAPAPPAAPVPEAEPTPIPVPLLERVTPVAAEPVVAAPPEIFRTVPEPVPPPPPVVVPEPEPEPEPIRVAPEPLVAEPEPILEEPEPVSAEPEPISAAPRRAEPARPAARKEEKRREHPSKTARKARPAVVVPPAPEPEAEPELEPEAEEPEVVPAPKPSKVPRRDREREREPVPQPAASREEVVTSWPPPPVSVFDSRPDRAAQVVSPSPFAALENRPVSTAPFVPPPDVPAPPVPPTAAPVPFSPPAAFAPPAPLTPSSTPQVAFSPSTSVVHPAPAAPAPPSIPLAPQALVTPPAAPITLKPAAAPSIGLKNPPPRRPRPVESGLSLSDRPAPFAQQEDDAASFRKFWKFVAAGAALLVAGLAAASVDWTSPEAAVAPGVLIVETTPAGSEVFIDGKPHGKTPARVEVEPGSHEVKLTRNGASHAWAVEVVSGARRVEKLNWSALQQTGGIEVVTNAPGAKVLVDGQARGATPLTLTDLTPGRHTVVVQGPSGSVRRTVTVTAGKTSKLEFEIYSGWVVVSAPIELQVATKGSVIGTAGEGPLVLPAGRHAIELINESLGYRESYTVEIEPGEEERITVRPTGPANINAIPWAEVYVDDVRLGETPLANARIPLGTREIVFKHPQYGERRVTTTISAAATAQITVDFTNP